MTKGCHVCPGSECREDVQIACHVPFSSEGLDGAASVTMGKALCLIRAFADCQVISTLTKVKINAILGSAEYDGPSHPENAFG